MISVYSQFSSTDFSYSKMERLRGVTVIQLTMRGRCSNHQYCSPTGRLWIKNLKWASQLIISVVNLVLPNNDVQLPSSSTYQELPAVNGTVCPLLNRDSKFSCFPLSAWSNCRGQWASAVSIGVDVVAFLILFPVVKILPSSPFLYRLVLDIFVPIVFPL